MSSQSQQERTKAERWAVLYQLAQASLPAFGLTGGSLTYLPESFGKPLASAMGMDRKPLYSAGRCCKPTASIDSCIIFHSAV